MIKYITYYDIPERPKRRNYVLSCVDKGSYILKTLSRLKYKVDVISASNSIVNSSLKKEKIEIFDGVRLNLLHGFGRGNKIKNIFSTLYYMLSFSLYLLFHLKKDDIVIVYHSLGYYKQIGFLKKIKKFKLIVEAEEIFSDVIGDAKTRNKELNFFKLADAFLFPTQLLDEKINTEKKPSIIVHGTYNVEKDYGEKFNDGRIHCVYAGTFDPRKGGVVAAAAAAQFLNENYHVHILGFGSENDKKQLITQIEEVQKKTKCKITFDGMKSGEEYIRFIQRCDIGLSTQNPNAEFNDTSFPSKILSYMSNGLRVVTIRIPAIARSAIDEDVFYYNEQNPEAIADTIKSIDFSQKYDSRKVINKLNIEFENEIINLLKFFD